MNDREKMMNRIIHVTLACVMVLSMLTACIYVVMAATEKDAREFANSLR